MSAQCLRCRQRERTERQRRKRWQRQVRWQIDEKYAAARDRLIRAQTEQERARMALVTEIKRLTAENDALRHENFRLRARAVPVVRMIAKEYQ